jgi:Lon protease-like protein
VPVIPIFPLDLVLLPTAPLPLHIFEPRYKEMIGECLDMHTEFGIVRAKDEDIEQIGCTAEITELTKKYDDGRMDITVAGRSRFEIDEMVPGRSFMQARISFVPDELEITDGASARRALEFHRELLKFMDQELEVDVDEDDLEIPQLSYRLAGPLPIDLDFKQALLAMRAEPERIEGLIRFYERILPRLRVVTKAREKAGGNGHGR